MRSQNASFLGPTRPGPRIIDPPGEFIALQLQTGLKSRGWDPGEVDNWRDSGWLLTCRRGPSELEMIVVAHDPRWFLQIAPIRLPGPLGRLLGRTPSATPADTYDLARDVHQLLASDGFAEFLWRWDGLPDGEALGSL
jgi:hypothetical protein